jgi:hypothetical protein
VQVSQVSREPIRSRTELTRAAVEGEAAPLMMHTLSVYYSIRYRRGDEPLRSLRSRGLRFDELATVWVDADRSGRSFEETAAATADRRNGRQVFQAADMPSDDPNALLRDAAERYYVLGAGTVRELEARGWTLGDVLTAGNLEQRSSTTFWQIVALREGGRDWSEVATELGVPTRDLYQPRSFRRASAAS